MSAIKIPKDDPLISWGYLVQPDELASDFTLSETFTFPKQMIRRSTVMTFLLCLRNEVTPKLPTPNFSQIRPENVKIVAFLTNIDVCRLEVTTHNIKFKRYLLCRRF